MQRGRPPLPAAALAGAVDLSTLKRPAPNAPPPGVAASDGSSPAADGGPPDTVIDVTEATFNADVIERSRQVPVILDFWAEWCGPCKQFSPVIEKVARESGGSWVLARIDVDANQRLAAAAQVQGIPAIKAVVDGQIVAEFSGAIPETNFRQWVTALLDAATGGDSALPGEAGAPGEEVDPRLLEAEAALQRGDADAAEAAYRAVLADHPGDALAASGVAQVELLRRVAGISDPAQALAAAQAAPDDVDAQLLAADVELLMDQVENAFGRLVSVVRRMSGADRDAARTRLLSLFGLLAPDDPRVATARRNLTAALF